MIKFLLVPIFLMLFSSIGLATHETYLPLIYFDLREKESIDQVATAFGQELPIPYEESDKELKQEHQQKCNRRQAAERRDTGDYSIEFILWGKNPSDPNLYLCMKTTMSKQEARIVCRLIARGLLHLSKEKHEFICGPEDGVIA